MKRWKKWSLGVLVCLACLFSGMGISYSSLKAGYAKVIRIAYMNGYVDALDLDLETIQKLKEDLGLLKKTVVRSADGYVDKVSKLNESKHGTAPEWDSKYNIQK